MSRGEKTHNSYCYDGGVIVKAKNTQLVHYGWERKASYIRCHVSVIFSRLCPSYVEPIPRYRAVWYNEVLVLYVTP